MNLHRSLDVSHETYVISPQTQLFENQAYKKKTVVYIHVPYLSPEELQK